MAANRIKRLKDLMDRLERLPASPDRDRVLGEVRSRAVDLDTGVTPCAMPLRKPVPVPVQPKPPALRRPAGVGRQALPATAVVKPPPQAPEPAPPVPAAVAHDLEQPLPTAEYLWLDDDQPPLDDSLHLSPQLRAGRRAVPPWTLGLRG